MGGKRTTAVATGAAAAQPLANAATTSTTAAASETGAPANEVASEDQLQPATDQTEAPEAEQSPERVRVCVLNHSGHALTFKGITEALQGLQLALPPCGKSDSVEIDAINLPDMEEAVSFAQTSNFLRPGALQLHIEKAIK